MQIDRIFVVATAMFAALILNGAVRAGAQRETTMTCSNQSSGATWIITIDFDKSTVDSHPARIGATEISWHDPSDGGRYTLDRRSGELTMIVPSSTGGYMLHHRCRGESAN